MIIDILLMCFAIVISITIHEFAKAVTATNLGDPTPKNNNRLTINPIRHFEPIGFLLMLSTSGYGWGKPVPINTNNFRKRRYGTVLTVLIPSIANFLVALFFNYILIYAVKANLLSNEIWAYVLLFIRYLIIFNLKIIVFNIIPIPPLDTSRLVAEFMSRKNYFVYMQYEKIYQLILVFCMISIGSSSLLDVVLTPIFNALYYVIELITF